MITTNDLITFASPTLAGLKTGSLFSCMFHDSYQVEVCLDALNALLKPKGLYILPIGKKRHRTLLYIYRRSFLENDLKNKEVSEKLKVLGYDTSSIDQCIQELASRIDKSSSFPHEIGLFLGYPLCDVVGYMENKPCKCFGCWKVYENEEESIAKFKKYNICTNIYKRNIQQGLTLEQLAIVA